MNAIVTGASRGLGKDIALFLAEQKFDLFLVASSLDNLQKLQREIITKHDVKVSVYPCDFSNTLQSELLCEKLKKEVNTLDILINNVGVFEMGTLEESPIEQLQRLIRINLEASYLISNAFVPLLKKQQNGHVFNVGSIVSKLPKVDAVAYSISKIALNGFTKLLREELKDFKVKVTEIIPGSINTSSWDGIEGVPKEEFIQTSDIIIAIWMSYQSNAAVNLEEIVIRPLNRNF